MKKILHLTLFLALISAVAGGALAAVNNVTAPIIAENAIKVEKAALEKLYPGADFEIVEFTSENKEIVGLFKASGKSEAYIYKMTVKGYKADITYLVGIDAAGAISGYEVLAQEETAGLGSKVAEDNFKNSLLEQPVNTEFDSIAGATVSSKAVLNGISIAAQHYADNLGELGEPGTVEKNYGTIDNVVENGDGTTTYTVTSEGFLDVLTFEITVDANQTITAFVNTVNNDSDDYGQQIKDANFTDKFVGTQVSEDFSGVDAISGVTISSTAAFNAVKAIAVEAAK